MSSLGPTAQSLRNDSPFKDTAVTLYLRVCESASSQTPPSVKCEPTSFETRASVLIPVMHLKQHQQKQQFLTAVGLKADAGLKVLLAPLNT